MARGKRADSLRLIGCCGANCSTCRSFILGQCRGCKIGYDDGTRSLKTVKCKVKLCCLTRGDMVTCADCGDYQGCDTIRAFHERKESKYRRDYHRPVDYIRKNGYSAYLRGARKWRGPFGPLG